MAKSIYSIALWDRKRLVVGALGTLCLAHWALLYRTMFVLDSQWNDDVGGCVVTATNPSLLNVTFFYSKWWSYSRGILLTSCDQAMGFDFIILVFTAVALLKKHSARTDLWKLLFQDGLVYFLVSFSANCIPAVRVFLQLQAIYWCDR